MSCSRRRIIMTQWVGAAFREYLAKYQKTHEKCCKRSGLLVALDDVDLDEIRLEGDPTWRVPMTAVLDDDDRAYCRELVDARVVQKPTDLVDVETFCWRHCTCNCLRNVLVSVRVCIS